MLGGRDGLFLDKAVPTPAVGALPDPLRASVAAGLALKEGLDFRHRLF